MTHGSGSATVLVVAIPDMLVSSACAVLSRCCRDVLNMIRSMKLSTDAPWSSLAHRSWRLDSIVAVALGWSEAGMIGDGGK
jgi:hypothetical protein